MCAICARLGLIVSGWLLTYPQILQLLGQGCLHATSVRVSRTPGWSWEAEDKVCVCVLIGHLHLRGYPSFPSKGLSTLSCSKTVLSLSKRSGEMLLFSEARKILILPGTSS